MAFLLDTSDRTDSGYNVYDRIFMFVGLGNGPCLFHDVAYYTNSRGILKTSDGREMDLAEKSTSWMKENLRDVTMYHPPQKKEEKVMVKTDRVEEYSFSVSGEAMIDYDLLDQALTKDKPVAILSNEDGGVAVYVHDSVYWKARYIKKALRDELFGAHRVFGHGNKFIKDHVAVGRLLDAIKAVRLSPLRKKYRNRTTIKVKLVRC